MQGRVWGHYRGVRRAEQGAGVWPSADPAGILPPGLNMTTHASSRRRPADPATGCRIAPQTPSEVHREFLVLTDGGRRIRCVGAARRRPERLLALGYVPRYKLELFNVTFYVCDARKNEDLRFAVAYLALRERPRHRPSVYARILYKDGSLLWRCASHFAKSAHENWIGKGDARLVTEGDDEYLESAEYTTDLPLEMQAAMEEVTRRTSRTRVDRRAVPLVVRRSGDDRLMAYRDFIAPRREAVRRRTQLVHAGKPVARFTCENDPSSLVFVRGYEPDFSRSGIVEVSESRSRLYGGRIERYRILSRNRRIQYLFFAGPSLVWIGYPQALTTELSRFGVRMVDVIVPDDLVVPGMEYHYLESHDPPVWLTQIPLGFAGPVSPIDPWRADASAWLDRLPTIIEFRKRVLARRRRSRTRTR